MSDSPVPPRPQTPQVLLHRLPDKSSNSLEATRKPSKYIILIMGSTGVAGKLQIARSVASALSCPLHQGDSMHESSAKAASIGASRPATTVTATATTPHVAQGAVATTASGELKDSSVQAAASPTSGPNEARYQRMWLSKLTRTGLLFPEESRPATEGFSGFGGTSSTSTSRRGSASSVASVSSNPGPSSSVASSRGEFVSSSYSALSVAGTLPPVAPSSNLNGVFTLSEEERRRRANLALMVLTHPVLDSWHKLAIRTAVGDYGIGVIYVPLCGDDEEEDEEDLPVLRPLDPTTMTSFPVSFSTITKKARGWGSLDREMKIRIDMNADVEGKTAEIIEEVRDVMGVDEQLYSPAH